MASNWGSMTEKTESTTGKVSYFLNISIKSKGNKHEQSQPTVRIKIPKLLVKTIHQKKKRKELHNNDDDDDDGNDDDNLNMSLVKHGNPANKFIKEKITSLFSNVVSKFKNSASSAICSRCNRTMNSFNGRNREIKEQFFCTSCRVLKKIRGFGRKGMRKKMETDDEDEGDEELCKRRILMGERCRPENELSE